MSSNKRRGGGFLVLLLIIGVCIGLFYAYRWHKDETTKVKESVEAEFYKPVMLNDSTMHMNITESSCILLQIDNDTLIINSHNVSTLNYDDKNHELVIVRKSDYGNGNFEHTVKVIDLDTVFKNVPNSHLVSSCF